MKALPWFLAVCLATLLGHYHMYSQKKIDCLSNNLELTEKMASIERDSVRDLIHANQQLSSEIESAKTQSYVAGAVAAIRDPDNVEKIWHAGYDRGAEVQLMAQKAQEGQPSSTESALGF